jgi:hypothetical protein
MDIRIKGVSINEMYAYAQTLDPGGMGMGIYPNTGFVHVDYRAPGEPSYRWVDLSGHGSSGGARPQAQARPHRPRPQAGLVARWRPGHRNRPPRCNRGGRRDL